MVSRAGVAYRICCACGRCRLRGGLHRQHHCASPPACRRRAQKNGDQAIGRSRGGLTTKIHALVDGLGMLARFRLTGGQAGDSPEALPLLDELKPASLAADKAYDSNAILQHLESTGIQAVIPSRANRLEQRPLDEHLYASRNLVERFFCRIKQFRRVATRYDKLSERLSSFVAISASFIWTC